MKHEYYNRFGLHFFDYYMLSFEYVYHAAVQYRETRLVSLYSTFAD